MRQVLPHLVWIGHAGDGRDCRALLDAGIEAVVQLAVEEPSLQLPRELVYCRLPLVDGPANDGRLLGLAITAVTSPLLSRTPTLVCCGHGMSRSPAIVAAGLSQVHQEDPDHCLKQIAMHVPIDVAPALWNEVKQALKPQ